MDRDLLFLGSDELVDLADLEDYVEAVRAGYREHGRSARSEPRTKLFRAHGEGMLMYYGAILPETGVMGVFQYVGEFADGDDWFLTYLVDSDTGEPLAIVDSPGVNPYKTGATGAVGVDALARPDASVVGVIGTGVQATAQVLATATVRDVRRVRAYSPTAANRRSFAADLSDRLGIEVLAVGSAEEAVRGADVVIAATTAAEPVFDGRHLDPGTHVTAMGQSHPERRELDAETVRRAVYVPDDLARAEVASGELLGAIEAGAAAPDHVPGDLGDLLAGRIPGRERADQITVFDSGGTAIETVAATHLVHQRARAAGRGTRLSMTPGREAFSEF